MAFQDLCAEHREPRKETTVERRLKRRREARGGRSDGALGRFPLGHDKKRGLH